MARDRPSFLPCRLAFARPAFTRARLISRPAMWNITQPAHVDVATACSYLGIAALV
jgi:hypothetical protein